MLKSVRRLRSIESIEEQFIELDRRMAAELDAKTSRPRDVNQPATVAPTLRAVGDTGKSPFLRLAVQECPVPRRP